MVAEQAAEELVQRFRELFDDDSAFRGWYDDSFPRVYSFVLIRVGGNVSVASEITQETFVEGVRQRTTFKGASDPVTWLCGIARHKMSDYLRRLYRERRLQLELIQGEGEPVVQPDLDAREAVMSALRTLPPSQQAVLTMHYLDGMPMREIGLTLGKSESAIESLLTRARSNFRRTYNPGVIDG